MNRILGVAVGVAATMGALARELYDEHGNPHRLEVGVNSKEECALYDVYFNGTKQTQCVVADAQRGFIVRYVTQSGARIRHRNGGLHTERLIGQVKIVKQGAPAPAYDGS